MLSSGESMNNITRRAFLQQSIALTAGASAGLTAIRGLSAEPADFRLPEAPKAPEIKEPVVDPYADAVLVDGPPPPLSAGAFTIAMLPDTQYYSESFPGIYKEQTLWLVESRKERNIACVLHVGDLVNQNLPAQWKNAQAAMNLLDGRIPYFFTTGNHDYDLSEDKPRGTLLNAYFPVAKFKDLKTLAVSMTANRRGWRTASMYSPPAAAIFSSCAWNSGRAVT